MTDDITALRSTTPPSGSKAARDLEAGELRDVIKEGVYRGVMKAIAVYALISLLLWALISMVEMAN